MPRPLPSLSGRTAGLPRTEAATATAADPVTVVDRPLPMPLASSAVVPPVVDLGGVAAPAPANDLALAAAGQPVAAPADLAVERQLDIARDGAWLDQLAKDIVRTASAEGSLRFKLNPETLGSLHVEVSQGQGGASVRLTADTEAARAIIADARPQLVAEARAQGVRIAETHVDLSGQGQQQAQSQAGQGGQRGRDVPAQEYLTSWKPESVEEDATPTRRSAAERYA
jgi:flagellar hook-length control protein FliK